MVEFVTIYYTNDGRRAQSMSGRPEGRARATHMRLLRRCSRCNLHKPPAEVGARTRQLLRSSGALPAGCESAPSRPRARCVPQEHLGRIHSPCSAHAVRCRYLRPAKMHHDVSGTPIRLCPLAALIESRALPQNEGNY